MEEETIIIVSSFAAAWALLFILVIVVWVKVARVRRMVRDLQNAGRLRIQKLKLDSDKNHAFHNPTISPDEELSRRGYSMYVADEDVENGRGNERRVGSL